MSTIQERIAARAAAAVERAGGAQNDTVSTGGGGEGKTFKTAPAGKQKARLCGYIEVGKHENRFDPSKDPAHKFRLRFALFGKEDCTEEDGSPVTIDSKDLSVSRHEKAGAVKLFKQMFPKGDKGHFMEGIGDVFWLEITHREGKAKKEGEKAPVYANITMDSIVPGVKDLLDDEDNVIGQQPIACPPLPDESIVLLEWDNPSEEDFKRTKLWDKRDLRNSVGFAESAWFQLVGDGKDEKPANGGAASDAPGEEPQKPEPEAPKEPDAPVVTDGDLPDL